MMPLHTVPPINNGTDMTYQYSTIYFFKCLCWEILFVYISIILFAIAMCKMLAKVNKALLNLAPWALHLQILGSQGSFCDWTIRLVWILPWHYFTLCNVLNFSAQTSNKYRLLIADSSCFCHCLEGALYAVASYTWFATAWSDIFATETDTIRHFNTRWQHSLLITLSFIDVYGFQSHLDWRDKCQWQLKIIITKSWLVTNHRLRIEQDCACLFPDWGLCYKTNL